MFTFVTLKQETIFFKNWAKTEHENRFSFTKCYQVIFLDGEETIIMVFNYNFFSLAQEKVPFILKLQSISTLAIRGRVHY